MIVAALRRGGAVRFAVLAAVALAACRPAAPPPHAVPAPPPITALGQFKAVLINGGGKPVINFQSHLTHVRTLVEFLRANGVADADVTIFSSDGTDPAADLATRDTDSEPDAWLLPPGLGHALRPVHYVDSAVPGFTLRPATRDALRTWFASEGRELAPGDTLFLYVTDHGEQNKQDLTNNTIVLWHDSMSVSQLRELLAQLDPGVRVVMLMSQCFSGSFANVLTLPDGEFDASGKTCGYFASTADRPAYGCYPENRGVDGVGHSHRFFRALDSLGRMPEAEERVLVTDDSPDVPNTTSDFFLQQLLVREAQRSGQSLPEVVDRLLAIAFRNRSQWEPQIRLMDRIGSAFGMFSPRSVAELEQQSEMLPQVSEQLRTYAQRWHEALVALTVQNMDRFVVAHPRWQTHLTPESLASLDENARRQLAHELLSELVPFTKADRETYDRLELLRQRADTADAAAYRMEVRLGVVLRMRALLDEIAGQVYLKEYGTAKERATFAALQACENVNFIASPPFDSAAALDAPKQFPPLDDDRQRVQTVMPAWMGIQFRPPGQTHSTTSRSPGAVAVTSVFPGSAAATAGLQVGDVILGPPGKPFTEPEQVREWTMRREIGEPAALEVERDAKVRQITLYPEPYPMKMPELPGPPKVGSAAPPLQQLEPFRGDHTLAAGRPHLLFFWATWCTHCKVALPEVMAFAAARDVEVVAITDEDTDTLKGFFTQFGQPFPETVAIDKYRATFQAYGVSGTPTFVLVDADGVVRHYGTGYNPAKGLEIQGWDYRAGHPGAG